MTGQEFQEIIDQLALGEAPTLRRTVEGQIYIRQFLPASRLILLGGGHIAQPLCRIASMLDFSVTVVDDRLSFANSGRFPEAAQVICDDFRSAIGRLEIRASDYVCVITRGHRWDGECLRQILSGKLPFYLGIIGSKRRVSGLFQVLAWEGFDAALLGKIHAPIGLRIRAQTPAEIAVSICAELISERRKQTVDSEAVSLEHTETDLSMLRFLAEGTQARAFALVLSSTGSTPAKSGAMMAIDPLGRGYGTIGGGCSEAAVMAAARRLMGTGRSRILEIDMSNDVAGEEDMVCGGSMRVLLEDVSTLPAEKRNRDAFPESEQAAEACGEI